MKKIYMILLALVLILSGCSRQAATAPTMPAHKYVSISFTFNRTKTVASNQFAVWITDGAGKLVKTVFLTNFTAKGGWEEQADTVQTWVRLNGLGSYGNRTVDATSGATPKSGPLTYVWDCKDKSGKPVPAGDYKVFVEGTIYWTDHVVYSGTVHVGGDANTAEISAEYGYSSGNAKESNMIKDVKAAYVP